MHAHPKSPASHDSRLRSVSELRLVHLQSEGNRGAASPTSRSAADAMQDAFGLTAVLEHTNARLSRMEQVEETTCWLIGELEKIRQRTPLSEWDAICTACVAHPVHRLLLQDPYTSRAFFKPRGYAGDAEMIDFLYFGKPPATTSDLGRHIFRATTGSSNGTSVRERVRRLASLIDSAYDRLPDPTVLAMACGHFRELAMTRRYSRGLAFPSLLALDQDRESLATVDLTYKDRGVTTAPISVGGILRGKLKDSGFDLIYAAGLYDYLSDEIALRLTQAFAAKLRPGGRLVVANFLTQNAGRGYMEACMGWKLVCRDEQAMLALGLSSADPESHSIDLATDDAGNIVYLTINKKS